MLVCWNDLVGPLGRIYLKAKTAIPFEHKMLDGRTIVGERGLERI